MSAPDTAAVPASVIALAELPPGIPHRSSEHLRALNRARTAVHDGLLEALHTAAEGRPRRDALHRWSVLWGLLVGTGHEQHDSSAHYLARRGRSLGVRVTDQEVQDWMTSGMSEPLVEELKARQADSPCPEPPPKPPPKASRGRQDGPGGPNGQEPHSGPQDRRRGPSEEGPAGEQPSSGRFFGKATGLKVQTLARAVENLGPLATDTGERLYAYRDGLWHPDGARITRERIGTLLGEKTRTAHVREVLSVLTCREPLLVDRPDLELINCANGMLYWPTGELLPHAPEHGSLVQIPVRWNPSADCPEIRKFLSEVLPADAIDFAFGVIGYALLNGNPLHRALLLHGTGRNGKGTFLALVTALIGARNASSVTPQSLDENRFRAAELHGKLANLVGDVDPRMFRSTEVFKMITGGDLITAERKHGQPFQFMCRALLIAAFNALPRSLDTTEGFFSRWLVLPFVGYFPPGKADDGLLARLTTRAELEGLFVAAIEALRTVMEYKRFDLPDSVQKATRDYRIAADPLRAFLSECLRPADLLADGKPEAWMDRRTAYQQWQGWCVENGHMAGSQRRFYGSAEAAWLDVHDKPLETRRRDGWDGWVATFAPHVRLEGDKKAEQDKAEGRKGNKRVDQHAL